MGLLSGFKGVISILSRPASRFPQLPPLLPLQVRLSQADQGQLKGNLGKGGVAWGKMGEPMILSRTPVVRPKEDLAKVV